MSALTLSMVCSGAGGPALAICFFPATASAAAVAASTGLKSRAEAESGSTGIESGDAARHPGLGGRHADEAGSAEEAAASPEPFAVVGHLGPGELHLFVEQLRDLL